MERARAAVSSVPIDETEDKRIKGKVSGRADLDRRKGDSARLKMMGAKSSENLGQAARRRVKLMFPESDD